MNPLVKRCIVTTSGCIYFLFLHFLQGYLIPPPVKFLGIDVAKLIKP
jgi:hypothetical protein